jgi:mono/diheme cytochrome c family protein
MKIHKSIVSLGVILYAYLQVAVAEPDAATGKKLAQEWCARCHNVDNDGPFKLHPPSFASIAVFRSKDQIYGRIVFPPLHASMPQIGYMLTPDNVDELVAYIVSLESK